MPLYEYKCQRCGKTFEVLQKFSDKPLETHKACGGTVERLISPPAFQFKGSGWYITDYAKGHDRKGGNGKGESKAKPSENSAPKPAESKPSTSAESSSKP